MLKILRGGRGKKVKRVAIVLLLAVVALGLGGFLAETQGGTGTDWSSLIAAIKPAVVWILAETPQGTAAGSGFIISPDGYILTAAHVVADASQVTVVVEERDQYQATIAQYDQEADVALLKIQASGLTWVGLGDSDQVQYDEEIQVLGYPVPQAGVGFIAVAGVVQGFRQRDDVKLIQHNAPTDAGHSGGAVINAQGEVIGVHSEYWSKHSEFRLAVAINTAKRIIPSGVIPSGPPPTRPTPPEVPPGAIRVPEDYATLGNAIWAAPNGATIWLAPGTYDYDTHRWGPIGDKDLTIMGPSPDLVTLKGAIFDVTHYSIITLKNITIQAGYVRGTPFGVWNEGQLNLDNVRIFKSTFCRTPDACTQILQVVYVTEGGRLTIKNSKIVIGNGKDERFNTGIRVESGSQVIIQDSEISGLFGDGIYIEGGRITIQRTHILNCGGSAIEIKAKYHSMDVTIENSLLEGNGRGLDVSVKSDGDAYIALLGSAITKNNIGILIANLDHSGFRMRNNKVFRNYAGERGDGTALRIDAHDSTVTIENNEFADNEGFGIFINGAYGDHPMRISGNNIHDNWKTGLVIEGGNLMVTRNRTVDNDGWGIATYTKSCGFEDGDEDFEGTISGHRNEVHDNLEGDLCPPYPGPPWPEGFVEEGD